MCLVFSETFIWEIHSESCNSFYLQLLASDSSPEPVFGS